MNSMARFAALVGVLAIAGSAGAQVTSFNGDTTGQPIWNRPVAGNPPTSLSGVGLTVTWQSQPLYVTVGGDYVFQETATGAWDNFTFLYQNSFDPNAQLTNVLIGNDDNPSVGLSGFTYNLTPGTQYFFISTGFDTPDFGAFQVAITPPSGSGGVFLGTVPEPTSLALVGLGAGGFAWRRWRKKA